MNTLILQGSPRANDNTAWMADEEYDEQQTDAIRQKVVDLVAKL